MDTLVVHPAYWRRGHGTALVNWGMELARLDRVKQGVIAACMGEKLYLSRGYEKLDDVAAVDERDPEQHVRVGVLEFASGGLASESDNNVAGEAVVNESDPEQHAKVEVQDVMPDRFN